MVGPPGHHGRRSPSPMGAVVNGKQPHSGWMGPGVPPGPGGVPVGQVGYPGPGHGRSKGEWIPGDDRRRDYPIGSEEEEAERMMRERAQREDRREFFDRERDKQREQRDKERDRESMMMDMDRERHMQMMAQHRQGPPASGPPSSAPMHPHIHGMPGQHHPMGGRHHSRPHHHHVVHHHHHHGTSGPGGPPPPSVMHSPRAPRDYGETGPGSGHGQYPTEIINLSSKLGPPPPHRDDYPSNRELDFREKENREKERARMSRRSSPVPGSSSQSQPQSQGPLQPPLMESDRPISTPFAMASTQTMQASGSANGTSSPRLPSGYDGHLRSPGHRFSSTGRSVPPTAGPSTPSAVPPPSLPSLANTGQRDGAALSSPRRPPPLQSPSLISDSLRERDLEGMAGSSSGASMVPSSSPVLQGQRSPGPVKFGPPPPMTLGSSTNVAERDRVSGASTSGLSGAKGPFSAAVRPSAVGSKVRPGSPIGQVAKAVNNQPLVNSKVGLSGPGRAGTPVEIERKGPFTSPSARSVNGVVGGFDGDERDREREREKHRMLEDAKLMAGPGPLTPPTSLISSANASAPTSSPVALTSPSKMSVPQMVDGP
ncbi:hypothetical protein AGABI1DRAFT_114760 [Agaricus bisporus var. burnettii JB137-S8]|uniref:Uncharacterized protein n=1 Tax=Agaricus bisporus var. burnettii (strain JB137-S8 / ATCC MYA-4627 / FGSC 10392) TaxID=597362 RepID=K5VVL0_AGABU|nr:uncharacterized protein AGABI1DRAFT_114760 [Agaricus bisporus var. burnettii JB137-S8]EKM78514.1 hypothetical protein AGABI1DRAFT_114760 [Agaricus bisporus var. burnettii JB137-S8]